MKSLIKLTILAIVLSSCGGKDDSPATPTNAIEPGAFNLVFPDNNLICTEGSDISNGQVSIDFMWSASANATSYSLEITNLFTNQIINESSSTTSKAVTLSRDTQYSWKVTAIVSNKTQESTQWSFYSEGITQENYAPFPATIVVTDNSNDSIDIAWEGSDLDNDIISYEVYYGLSEEPALVHSATDDSQSLTQSIVYGLNYYLKIVTIDGLGNKSASKKTINFES